jgi:carbamoyltransferase
MAGLHSVKQVDIVAYAWSKGLDAALIPNVVQRIQDEILLNPGGTQVLLDRIRWEEVHDSPNRKEFEAWVVAAGVRDRVRWSYHHEAHAYSAALFSPFDRALVVTADGRGDYESASVWRFDRSRLEPLERVDSVLSNDSLGYFYGRITALLGYRPMRHEGKVTGLAAFGDPRPAKALMKSMIGFVDGSIRAANGPMFRPFFLPLSQELKQQISFFRPEDVAAAAQEHLEEVIAAFVSQYLDISQPVDVALAGGVFANVRVNEVIKRLPGVDRVFVQPHMGDGGLCLGASAAAAHAAGLPVSRMRTARLGPVSPVGKSARRSGLSESSVDSQQLVARTLESLIKSEVVGLVRGKMEFGPRALCGRSILYRTSDVTVNDWLNERLHRTEFMPFAPVTTTQLAARCFLDFDEHDPTMPFMTSTVRCSDEFRAACPAVCHVDGTARPQVVSAEDDPFMHALITAWFERTGELALINTSFNMHEEPIIFTANRGREALLAGVIDLLVLDESFVNRQSP